MKEFMDVGGCFVIEFAYLSASGDIPGAVGVFLREQKDSSFKRVQSEA